MPNFFWRLLKNLVITSVAMLMLIIPLQGSLSKSEPSETEVLQRYLSIHEVEKELDRVAIQEANLLIELDNLSSKISLQLEQMQSHKERAANIARAYYMGDRNDLLLLLFSTNDLQQFIRMYDSVSYMFEKDREDLYAFHQQVEQLRALYVEKETQAQELEELQKHLVAQKNMLRSLDAELESMLSQLSDREKFERLQAMLIHDWETRGLPAFDLFLRTISTSMSGMAEHVKDNIRFSFSGARLTISDTEFTTILQKQNELFKDFRINFAQDSLTFFGTYEDIVLTMTGTYQLESEDMVRFYVEELKYNGYILPSSTAKALENEYDLGIYPKQINERLRIKEIQLDQGQLEIVFTLNL